jgi:GPH family glycoside/pentoside/hexuronide:cation symporter
MVAAFLVTIIVPILAQRGGGYNLAPGYLAALGVMGGLAILLFLFCFFTTTARV